MYREQIEKELKKIYRNRNTPDLHSFTVMSKEGVLFVEAVYGGVEIAYEGGNAILNLDSAVELLVRLEVDLETLET
jgi:hypothetical protein